MADETDGVIQRLAGGERLMSTLMGQHPQPGAEETLKECIQSPETRSQGYRRNIYRGEESMGENEGGG